MPFILYTLLLLYSQLIAMNSIKSFFEEHLSASLLNDHFLENNDCNERFYDLKEWLSFFNLDEYSEKEQEAGLEKEDNSEEVSNDLKGQLRITYLLSMILEKISNNSDITSLFKNPYIYSESKKKLQAEISRILESKGLKINKEQDNSIDLMNTLLSILFEQSNISQFNNESLDKIIKILDKVLLFIDNYYKNNHNTQNEDEIKKYNSIVEEINLLTLDERKIILEMCNPSGGFFFVCEKEESDYKIKQFNPTVNLFFLYLKAGDKGERSNKYYEAIYLKKLYLMHTMEATKNQGIGSEKKDFNKKEVSLNRLNKILLSVIKYESDQGKLFLDVCIEELKSKNIEHLINVIKCTKSEKIVQSMLPNFYRWYFNPINEKETVKKNIESLVTGCVENKAEAEKYIFWLNFLSRDSKEDNTFNHDEIIKNISVFDSNWIMASMTQAIKKEHIFILIEKIGTLDKYMQALHYEQAISQIVVTIMKYQNGKKGDSITIMKEIMNDVNVKQNSRDICNQIIQKYYALKIKKYLLTNDSVEAIFNKLTKEEFFGGSIEAIASFIINNSNKIILDSEKESECQKFQNKKEELIYLILKKLIETGNLRDTKIYFHDTVLMLLKKLYQDVFLANDRKKLLQKNFLCIVPEELLKNPYFFESIFSEHGDELLFAENNSQDCTVLLKNIYDKIDELSSILYSESTDTILIKDSYKGIATKYKDIIRLLSTQ